MSKRECESLAPDPKRTCSNDLALLNDNQRKVYDIVINNTETLRLIVHGTAGTGKSFLIQCIKTHLSKRVLLTAPTGVAAFNIQGETLHSLFSLPVNRNFAPLEQTALKKLQLKMKSVDYIIIDEMSMIGLRLFDMVAKRLREIEKENINIILFGDFGQLPPVRDLALFSTGGDNMIGKNLYATFQKTVFLTDNMRQSEDEMFKSLLNSMRDGQVSHDNWLLLMKRDINKVNNLDEFENAVEIHTTRAAAETVNQEKLLELGEPIKTIYAIHTGNANPNTASSDLAGGLEVQIILAEKCRVMLTSNINVDIGLVNGALGIVQSISNEEISVLFDHMTCPTTIYRVTSQWEIMNDKCSRSQFPLRLSWALTVHKAQGLTLNKVKLNLGSREFCTGLTYVACSRVRKMNDLIISPCSYNRLKNLRSVFVRKIEENRLRQMEI